MQSLYAEEHEELDLVPQYEKMVNRKNCIQIKNA